MNARRKSLLIVLLIVLVLPVFVGPIGTVELAIWLALIVAWLVAFIFWAKTPSSTASTTPVGHST